MFIAPFSYIGFPFCITHEGSTNITFIISIFTATLFSACFGYSPPHHAYNSSCKPSVNNSSIVRTFNPINSATHGDSKHDDERH